MTAPSQEAGGWHEPLSPSCVIAHRTAVDKWGCVERGSAIVDLNGHTLGWWTQATLKEMAGAAISFPRRDQLCR